MAVWEGAAISTQSKPRCCSKVLALTVLNQHYTVATWGIEKCINSFGIPQASSQEVQHPLGSLPEASSVLQTCSQEQGTDTALPHCQAAAYKA